MKFFRRDPKWIIDKVNDGAWEAFTVPAGTMGPEDVDFVVRGGTIKAEKQLWRNIQKWIYTQACFLPTKDICTVYARPQTTLTRENRVYYIDVEVGVATPDTLFTSDGQFPCGDPDEVMRRELSKDGARIALGRTTVAMNGNTCLLKEGRTIVLSWPPEGLQ